MEIQNDNFEKLYADTFNNLHEGSIVRGKVLQIKADGVIVDVGYKREGFIPIGELLDDEYKSLVAEDEIDVHVTGLHDKQGFIKLSRQKAAAEKTWSNLEDALNNGTQVNGKITGKVKGGMTVSIGGVMAFLPGSQIDLKVIRDTDALIGQTLAFRVIKLDQKTSNVIISRRVILEEERNKQKDVTLVNIKEGAVMKGTVKNLTDYGAFIDLGGIDGLLHISDMSWGRISHPSELFSVDDEIDVVVLSFDPEKEKVTLGYKQRKADPWMSVEAKYPLGAKVSGKVIGITDYGVFIELEEGVEGLVHVSEIDWLEKVKKPSKYFSIGEIVETSVLSVNSSDKKISLSIKQLKANPWDLVKEKYTVGQQVKGTVKSFTDFGAFIGLDEGVDALLHISDLSWVKHIRHPSDVLEKGQEIEVAIIEVDADKRRISVGLKSLTPDPWITEIPNKYGLGDPVTGKVTNVADFGVFVELKEGVEALLHISEIDKKPSEKTEDIFKPGDELTARIIHIDLDNRKIGLSTKTMAG
ncbi:MAG: 30S ribosomal protein S1 [Thermodesulfovibrionia bacterium]|nr:30S ribosomal protein S1 [Thermodesulfovibrionia bacterium]